MKDNRHKSQSNQTNVLIFIHRFGWLTTRMLAALVWPNSSQAISMARRTVKRLVAEKLLIKRELPSGTDCFLLGAKGVRLLDAEFGIATHSGQSLVLGNHIHRACSNWFLIHKLANGFPIWTEHEIASRRAPVNEFLGKMPDGMFVTEEGAVWVEVENAWKNRTRRDAISRLCERGISKGPELIEKPSSIACIRIRMVRRKSSSVAESVEIGGLYGPA